MAKECRDKCPLLQGSSANLALSNPVLTLFEGYAFPFTSHEQALEIYRGDVERAEHCPGPVDEPVLVRRGLPWNRRTVTVTKIRCGLSQPSPCAIPPELVEV